MNIDELAKLMGKTRKEVEHMLKTNDEIELDLTREHKSDYYKGKPNDTGKLKIEKIKW